MNAHKMLELIDNLKEKITDKEYLELVNEIKKFHIPEKKEKCYIQFEDHNLQIEFNKLEELIHWAQFYSAIVDAFDGKPSSSFQWSFKTIDMGGWI